MMDAAPAGIQPNTRVLLCADLETLGHGLDCDEIRNWLHAAVPSVQVRTVANLCRQPSRIARAVDAEGGARLVLGLCSRDHARAELQAQARKIGVDPLGVEVVNLGAHAALAYPRQQATDRAKILLAGAVAKVRAFRGSRPENSNPRVPAALNRRSLLTLSFLEYETVPAVQVERCHVDQGCDWCVHACPHEALLVDDGSIRLEKTRCTSCGVCVTACPHEAVDLPGHTPAQLSAQVGALLGAGPGDLRPRGILFACQDSEAVLERLARQGISCPANWLPVEVPCVEMVPPTWLLACLTLDAAAVGVLPCAGRCRTGRREDIEDGVAYCRELLRGLGELDDRVTLLPAGEQELIAALPALQAGISLAQEAGPGHALASPPPFVHGMRAQVLLRLAQDHGAGATFSMMHPHSPFGVIEVSAGCTTCGGCAAACPADALALERRSEDVTLTFDATLCTACGQCLPACPEADVLRLHRITDLACLSRGRVALFQDRYARCRSCGQPIASEMMVRRIAALLADQPAATIGLITQHCADCRAAPLRPGQPQYTDAH